MDVYASRRAALRSQMGTGSAALVASPTPAIRSRDTDYIYRADSNVVYLTGFSEPNAVALILPSGSDPDFVLFVNPRDPEKEQWVGRRAGTEGAMRDFGAGAAHDIATLRTELEGYLLDIDTLYLPFTGFGGALWETANTVMRTLRSRRGKPQAGPRNLSDVDRVLGEMRRIKSAHEIEIMRQAARISGHGHAAAAEAIRPGVFEYEVEAAINHAFRRHGASGPSYNTIVGAGVNATILHYVENQDRIGDTDAVLVDAGAEYQFYAGDITRTYPAGGRFTAAQRELYQLVLDAEKNAITAAQPGAHFKAPHDAALDTLIDGLLGLGLLTGSRDAILEEETYKRFYMHSTSHYLGIDVHDVGSAWVAEDEPRPLDPGVVITIEPGLYISPDDETVPEHYRGIGIRIEDDILITETGNDNLTSTVPKELDDVEWAR